MFIDDERQRNTITIDSSFYIKKRNLNIGKGRMYRVREKLKSQGGEMTGSIHIFFSKLMSPGPDEVCGLKEFEDNFS